MPQYPPYAGGPVYRLPNFNITCNIFTGPTASPVLRSASPCNLQYGNKTTGGYYQFGGYTLTSNFGQHFMYLLLPKGTDVRDVNCTTGYDVVEVPAGSGRKYVVGHVDDVGRGFPNEYRVAWLSKSDIPWPTPIP